MSHYYNEIDPYCAAWLQNLMDVGHIPAGDVDTRSIEDVRPDELAGYVQCHFFAGIAGWPLALAIAGWPADRPVCTGSCPCQPFSAAGKGAGFADERHLWPAWQHLIAQCRPAVVFGEQVASKAVDPWIDLVHADMEGMGYAFGCVPFPSAGVGAPHIRDRNYWVADATRGGWREEHADGARRSFGDSAQGHAAGLVHGGRYCRLAHADGGHASAERQQRGGEQRQQPQDGGAGGVAYANRGQRDGIAIMRGNERNGEDAGRAQSLGGLAACGDVRGMADSNGARSLPCAQAGVHRGEDVAGSRNGEPQRSCAIGERAGPTNGQWGAADWLACTDGKWRPVEPGTFPLAHGLPNRVGRLRAYGNAINPHQAAEFILAYAEARGLIALERAA